MSNIVIELVADPRDVLQGLNYQLDDELYVEHLCHIAQAGFKQIMVGSLINEKLVPAMANSEKRAISFAKKYPSKEITRQILIFKSKGQYIEKAKCLIDEGAINSFAYTHSLCGEFLYNNNGIGRKEYSFYDESYREQIIDLSRQRVKELAKFVQENQVSLDIHLSKVTHKLSQEEERRSRIEEIAQEISLLGEILQDTPGRILLSDTGGEATPEIMEPLVKKVWEVKVKGHIKNPLGLHLHTNPADNESLLELMKKSLKPIQNYREKEIVSFDIGFGGMGGCQFNSDNPKANLQVINILQISDALAQIGIEISPCLDKSRVEELDQEVKKFIQTKPDSTIKTIFEKFRSLFVTAPN